MGSRTLRNSLGYSIILDSRKGQFSCQVPASNTHLSQAAAKTQVLEKPPLNGRFSDLLGSGAPGAVGLGKDVHIHHRLICLKLLQVHDIVKAAMLPSHLSSPAFLTALLRT